MKRLILTLALLTAMPAIALAQQFIPVSVGKVEQGRITVINTPRILGRDMRLTNLEDIEARLDAHVGVGAEFYLIRRGKCLEASVGGSQLHVRQSSNADCEGGLTVGREIRLTGFRRSGEAVRISADRIIHDNILVTDDIEVVYPEDAGYAQLRRAERRKQ